MSKVDLTKGSDLRRVISRAMRTPAARQNWDPLAYRQQLRDRIAKYAEDGKIAICRQGRDCDGVQYWNVTHVDVPTSILAFIRDEDEHVSWLDGPESMSILNPSDQPEGGESWGGWN